MIRRLVRTTGLVVLLVGLPLATSASDDVTSGVRGWTLFPDTLVSRPYVADPLQPRFRASLVSVADGSIAESGAERFDLALGGRFGLLRSTPGNRPERPWQLNIEAGFVGQFDRENSLDNIGWDGLYGLTLDKRLTDRSVLKIAVKHYSSHVGDELQERTGRKRINYTREETIVGLTWKPVESWRLYGEAAWGHELRTPELQEPWRLQAGLELASQHRLPAGMTWFAACDLGSFEESDWEIDATVQIGLAKLSGARTWRFGLEARDGRSPIGEFFRARERWVGLGIWLDPWR